MKLLFVFAAVLLSSVVTAKVPHATKVPHVTVSTHTHDEDPVVAEVVEVTSQPIDKVVQATEMPVIVEVSAEQMVTKVPQVVPSLVNQVTNEVPKVVEIVGVIVKPTVTPVEVVAPNVVKVPMARKMCRSVVDELVQKPVVEVPKVPEVPKVVVPAVPVVPVVPVVPSVEVPKVPEVVVPVVPRVELPIVPVVPKVPSVPVVAEIQEVPVVPAVSADPVVSKIPVISQVPKMRSMAENTPLVPLSMALDADKTVNVVSEKSVDRCDQQCTKFNLNPICSTNGQCNYEFPNQCVMDTFNCKHPELGFKATMDDRCKMHWLKRCTEKDLMG